MPIFRIIKRKEVQNKTGCCQSSVKLFLYSVIFSQQQNGESDEENNLLCIAETKDGKMEAKKVKEVSMTGAWQRRS